MNNRNDLKNSRSMTLYRRMSRNIGKICVIIFICVLSGACSSSPNTSIDSSNVKKVQISFFVSNTGGIPKVPADTEFAPGQTAHLKVLSVSNVELDDFNKFIGKPKVEGQGHLHVYLDANSGQLLAESGAHVIDFAIPAGTSIGAHKISVDLVNNDHSPWTPPYTDSKDIKIISIAQMDGGKAD